MPSSEIIPSRSILTGLAARALLSGTCGCLASAAALALVARAEGKAAAQPLNATGHWLHGDRVARFRGLDAVHTGTGFATHLAATIFWAGFFEAWEGPSRRPGRLGRAAAVAALAAAVDYTITPHRFTPGWELVLSKRGMALAYAAMALGFVATPG